MRPRTLCAAVAVLGIAYAGLAADVPLETRNAALRFAHERRGPATEARMSLSGRFDPLAGPSHVEFQEDALALSFGGAQLLQIDPLDPRLRWRRKGTKITFRQRRGEGGAQYLMVDLLRGRFRFRGSRVSLPGVQAAGAWGVPVTLTVGDATLSGEVDFLATRNRRGARWRSVHGPRAERPLPLGDFGDTTNVRDQRMVVIRGDEDWAALWAEHAGGTAPEVDFASHMIVAIFAGERPSGGYGVRLDSVQSGEGDHVIVRFTETRPGPHCVVFTAITYPFTIARVPRVDGTPVFDGRERVHRCRP